jgi:hypothetical protein
MLLPKEHFAAGASANIADHAQSLEVRSEHPDHDTRSGAAHERRERFADLALAGMGRARVDVRAVREEQPHPRLAELGEPLFVGELAVGGRGVETEVAGVDDGSGARLHDERRRVGDRMSDAHRFHLEGSDGIARSRGDGDELEALGIEPALDEPVLRDRQCVRRPHTGTSERRKKVGQGRDVVFVAVRA